MKKYVKRLESILKNAKRSMGSKFLLGAGLGRGRIKYSLSPVNWENVFVVKRIKLKYFRVTLFVC